jgi:hypothetical protein
MSHINPNVSYDGLCPSHLGAFTSYPISHTPMHVHISSCSGTSNCIVLAPIMVVPIPKIHIILFLILYQDSWHLNPLRILP